MLIFLAKLGIGIAVFLAIIFLSIKLGNGTINSSFIYSGVLLCVLADIYFISEGKTAASTIGITALVLFAEVAAAVIVGKRIAPPPNGNGDDKEDPENKDRGYDLAASLLFYANAGAAAFFAVKLTEHFGLFG